MIISIQVKHAIENIQISFSKSIFAGSDLFLEIHPGRHRKPFPEHAKIIVKPFFKRCAENAHSAGYHETCPSDKIGKIFTKKEAKRVRLSVIKPSERVRTNRRKMLQRELIKKIG